MNRRVLLMTSIGVYLALSIVPIAAAPKALEIYLPGEEEVERLFNLQAYLSQYNREPSRVAETDKLDGIAQLSLQYHILQTYMFEAFLQISQNRNVTKYYQEYVARLKQRPDYVERTLLLMNRPVAPGGEFQSPPYTLSNGKTAEWIDLFELAEIAVFDGRLHSMVFANNNWARIGVKEDPTLVGYACGGGSNAFLMNYRRHAMGLADFIRTKVESDFLAKRYENWTCRKIEPDGVLQRAGADVIYVGQGTRLEDTEYMEGVTVLYFYSKKYLEGYEISWMMNFSSTNVFFDAPERTWHQLAETLLLSWVE